MKSNNKIQTKGDHDNDLVSLEKAAKFIKMSKSFLKSVKNRNEIPYYQLGGSIRFKISDLKQFIESCRVEGRKDEAT